MMTNPRFLMLALVSCLGVSGCSYMPSWMGGNKEEKPKLAGQRIAVLPVTVDLKPDVDAKDPMVTLPPTNANNDWPQHTGVFTPTTSNLAAGGMFDKAEHVNAGEGNSFGHTLLIRPVVGGGLVFAMDAVGHISAHDAADIENVRWVSKGVVEEDEPDTMGGGLAYDQGKLYVTSGRGAVGAFDATTGKEIWQKGLRVPLRSAPLVAKGKVFVITLDNQLFALNATDGDIAWNHRGISESAGLMNLVSPTISGDTLIVPYSSGEIYALSQATGKEIWSESLASARSTQSSAFFGGIGGDPLVDDKVVISVNSGGVLSVQSLATGQHVWQRPIGSLNTPWIAGDFMYVLTTDSTLLCLVKENGHVRWATQLQAFENQEDKKDPITWKGPVMVNGRLAVVASNGKMQLVSAIDGTITTSIEIPEDIYTAPVVAGGRMYLLRQDATLYSIE